jgi:hypothetical protein
MIRTPKGSTWNRRNAVANMTLYVPDTLAEKLKKAAERDRRSVSSYTGIVLERALSQPSGMCLLGGRTQWCSHDAGHAGPCSFETEAKDERQLDLVTEINTGNKTGKKATRKK